MPQLRLALAQVDPTVGDLPGNARLVRERTAEAARAGAHLVAFPEMVLTGYPVEDLALRASFVQASRAALRQLAADLHADGHGDLPVVVGHLDRAEDLRGGQVDLDLVETGRDEHGGSALPKGLPQNCAAVLHGGRVVARYAKHHLPTYGVFDEFRVFVPGRDLAVVRVAGVDVALAICEDLWQDGGPVAMTRAAGADLLLVVNGSPYERDKDDTRLELVRRRAVEAGCTLAYLNAVGGQDDLVFDGDSLVVDAAGHLLARGPQFAEALLVVDLDLPSEPGRAAPEPVPGVVRVVVGNEPVAPYEPLPPPQAPRLDEVGEVWTALVTGLRAYVRKNGFERVALGLSGGIDSAVVAALGVDALGAGCVTGVSMPSVHSSEHSKDDAADLARRTGLDYRVVPIAPVVDAFTADLAAVVRLGGFAEENLQARVRGTTLMALSNSEGHLVVATSNKSELAVGYSTLYGDSVGGFAPLKDVPKTLVWELARWRNAHAQRRGETPPIPERSITKPPSAELRPGQTDQDSLPPYEVLDAVLERYVVGAQGRSELLAAGLDPEVVDAVVPLVDRAEWKRRQFAPGTKISAVAFGRDRRLPITTRWREERSR
ncbi:NAD+ synthase [Quadrisphaera sp. DSM 44207]|uniref:NAD+ synthase n=1 Tax=Quadrisphaera sp. DSM 44207 TaxID=1881057 RepID=UPI000883411D|nr:NAD+ synthase [Quadrisphaera sp. DSM 44207]SDQ04135.1 NAD+ synthase (glutamine-hydrolysing) [Quadrisphaera sp. DSM 44207]